MIIFTAVHSFIALDFFIYRIYSFHINAMVIDIMLSPAAAESIDMGIYPPLLAITFIASILLIQYLFIQKLVKTNVTTKNRINKIYNKKVILPLIIIVLVEKFSYGILTIYSKNQIVMSFNVIPMYQPLTFTRFVSKHFDIKVEEGQSNTILKNGALKYPINPIVFNDKLNKPNIYLITVDSLSKFVVNEENTPNIHQLKSDSIYFSNHYSGGNATRFGIFSLFYGLNSTYWFPFLNENKAPVLIDALKEINYDINLVSSTNGDWPEFKQTAYVNTLDSLHDDFDGQPWQKDQQSTKKYLEIINDNKTPQFSFLFLDAPHGYSFPADFNKYNATNEDINYLTMSKDSHKLDQVKSRYKNSAYYNDDLVGKIIKQLKDDNLYDKSIIIFTADHGQEFYEQGYFAHNSAFTKTQVNVTFMIKMPGNQQSEYTNLSSHNDLVPTLLTYMGVKNPTSDYSNGINLLNDQLERDYIFTANWNNNAVITNDNTYVFSNLPNKMFKSEVRDNDTYKQQPNAPKINPQYLLSIMDANKQFMK
jgi:membrane-anchored protein YejM (alkaline phosphatase superfamily)